MPDSAALYLPLRITFEAEHLTSLAPGARISVDTGGGVVAWKGLRISLNRMPAEQLPGHLHGFREHIRTHGGNEALAIRCLSTMSVYGCVVEPGFDDEGRAMQFLAALNRATDGLCFMGGEIFDAAGRPLLLDGRLEPPDARRVAARTLLLLSLSVRGLLEQDAGTEREGEAEATREGIASRVMTLEPVREEAEPLELELLERPLGQVDEQIIIDAIWRSEGAALLLWALHARPLPAHDAQEHPCEVDASFHGPGAAQLLMGSSLRAPEEIEVCRRRLLGIHWRLVHQRVSPGPVDFLDFAHENFFGGFDARGIEIAEGDLAVAGVPVTRASAHELSRVSSIARERHQAANWLIGTHPLYSRVNTPT